ncbi:riboflavin kinase-like [Watersipora subatra]|uniref:riboflavin kinase-like n=1 Tax=Watersipora subatra TaxID=2589382 RepID=UPI00355C23F1
MSSLGTMARKVLPFFAKGRVVRGFGRGSKELGVPTANFPDDVVENLPEELCCGVYCGFASIDNGTVYPMCLSIGWNPYYKNEKRTMETHIIHNFSEDFYDQQLKLVIVDFIRPMLDFTSLDELKSAIASDIVTSHKILANDAAAALSKHEFFLLDEDV